MQSLLRAFREVRDSYRTPKPILVISLASVLIVLGAFGFFIPLFPGFALTLPGLLLLSLYSPTVYAMVQRRAQKHPKAQSITDRVRNWLINRIRPHR